MHKLQGDEDDWNKRAKGKDRGRQLRLVFMSHQMEWRLMGEDGSQQDLVPQNRIRIICPRTRCIQPNDEHEQYSVPLVSILSILSNMFQVSHGLMLAFTDRRCFGLLLFPYYIWDKSLVPSHDHKTVSVGKCPLIISVLGRHLILIILIRNNSDASYLHKFVQAYLLIFVMVCNSLWCLHSVHHHDCHIAQ